MASGDFKPYVPASESPAELTPKVIVLGAFLGIVFGASSVYLALKVGLTVSASIPIAVLSITLFRRLGKTTILENNMTQTIGSAGESIAAGVVFTVPALLFMGYDLEILRTTMLALTGGILGVLLMIPLRRSLIVQEHGRLTYPEGTACAEVLEAGEKGGVHARTIFTGFFVALAYKFLMKAAFLWKEVPEYALAKFRGAVVSIETSPELLGVGYIIGPRVAGIMVAGGVLASLVLIPAVYFFGDGLAQPLFPSPKRIVDMEPAEIWASYVRYIGAGAVAAGGLISLIRSGPTILGALRAGLRDVRGSKASSGGVAVPRTERDLPTSVTVGGAVALMLVLWALPQLGISFVGAVLIVIFGFLFTTVSARITGQIGASSNPISGMTIATILITCFLFVLAGWTGAAYRPIALSVGAVVCIAAANAGATSQDLKTGFLVGATPRRQQVGLLIGAVTSALFIGWTLIFLNSAYTTVVPRAYAGYQARPEAIVGTHVQDGRTYNVVQLLVDDGNVPAGRYLVDDQGTIQHLIDPGIGGKDRIDAKTGERKTKFDAPKPQLMGLLIDGILTQKLPWSLVLLGVFISIVLELCAVESLPFAVGLYLPLSTSTPIWAGGLVRGLVDRAKKGSESDTGPGVLFSSGLIAGGAIGGLVVAFAVVMLGDEHKLSLLPLLGGKDGFFAGDLWSILVFLGLGWFTFRTARRSP